MYLFHTRKKCIESQFPEEESFPTKGKVEVFILGGFPYNGAIFLSASSRNSARYDYINVDKVVKIRIPVQSQLRPHNMS